MAEKAGSHFASISNDCLMGLKNAIEYEMPANVKEKKSKAKQFKHAKDNAVSALGKIIKFQQATIDINSLIPNWLSLLPIKDDVEEAKQMNELLTDLLQQNPIAVLGQSYERFELIVILLSEIYEKKFLNEETVPKLSILI
jgi:importin-5